MTNIQKNNYNLSIRFTSDGFSLYIQDENNYLVSSGKTAFSFENADEQSILDIFSKQKELQLTYQSVQISIESDIYTFIPESFYSEDTKSLYINNLRTLPTADTIIKNRIFIWNAVLIYSIPAGLYSALQKFIPEIEIEHHLFSFIKNQVALKDTPEMYLYIRQNKFDIIATQNSDLAFVNVFDYTSAEDIVYYVLKTFSMLSLSYDLCAVHIYNPIAIKNLDTLLGKYIKPVEYLESEI